jgi:hypothetical protein
MSTKTKVACLLIAVVIGLAFVAVDIRSSNATAKASSGDDGARVTEGANADFDAAIRQNSQQMIDQGRTTFRFDTFGSESYWGDTLFHFEKLPRFNFKVGQFAEVTLTDPAKTDAGGNTRIFRIASPPFENELVFTTRIPDTAFEGSLKKLPLAPGDKL